MFEEANTIRSMISMFSATQTDVAKKLGVSQSYVANKIRLLGFSEEIRRLILERELSERHARVLLRLKDEKTVREAIDKISSMHLTVAESEALVDNMVIDSKSVIPPELSPRARIEKFDELLSLSIKNLESYGVRIKKRTDFYDGKRYITLCIDA